MVFETLARSGGKPRAIKVGNVSSEPGADDRIDGPGQEADDEDEHRLERHRPALGSPS